MTGGGRGSSAVGPLSLSRTGAHRRERLRATKRARYRQSLRPEPACAARGLAHHPQESRAFREGRAMWNTPWICDAEFPRFPRGGRREAGPADHLRVFRWRRRGRPPRGNRGGRSRWRGRRACCRRRGASRRQRGPPRSPAMGIRVRRTPPPHPPPPGPPPSGFKLRHRRRRLGEEGVGARRA
jgi:hypothetical protein